MSQLKDGQIDTVDRTDGRDRHTDRAHLTEKNKQYVEQYGLRFIKQPAISNSLQVNVMHVPALSCVNAARGSAAQNSTLGGSLKRPPGGVQWLCVVSQRHRGEKEREKDVSCSSFILSFLWMSLGQSLCPVCHFPSKHNLFVDSVGGGEKEGGVHYQSTAPPPTRSSYASIPTNLSPGSLFLTRLLWALRFRLPASIWPLRPFSSLPLLLLVRPLDPVAPVRGLAPPLRPVVCLAAVAARALVCGWGSWLGLAPFGNLLVLRDTGGDVGHPRFEVVLVGERGGGGGDQLIGGLLLWSLMLLERFNV